MAYPPYPTGTIPRPPRVASVEQSADSDRACLIGLAKAILDSVPGSLTAQERAVQFVTVLTPLIDGREA